MALIKLPDRQIRRNFFPDFPVELNTAHWAAKYCVAAIIPRVGASAYDAVNERAATGVGGPVFIGTERGRATKLAGNAYFTLPHNPAYNVTGELTIISAANLTTGYQYNAFCAKTAANGASANPYDFGTDNSAVPKLVLVRASSSYNVWNGPATVLNSTNIYGVTQGERIDVAPTFYVGTTPTTGTAGVINVTGAAMGDTSPLWIGRRQDGGKQLTGNLQATFIFNRQFSTIEYQSLVADLWALLRPRQRNVYLAFASGAATADLIGSATVSTGASASLSQSIPIAAAGISVATADAGISVAAALAGSAVGRAAAAADLSATSGALLMGTATATAHADGGLSLSVPLSTLAVAQAIASADVMQSTPVAGSASATAAGSAGLDYTNALSGAAAVNATATASIAINLSLAGSALAAALATAGLGVVGASSLSGAANASSAADASMTHGIPMVGTVITLSTAAGNLTQIVPVSSSAAALSSATGGLDIAVHLDGAALVTALAAAGINVTGSSTLSGVAAVDSSAAASLTLRVSLDGTALAVAQAAGMLAGHALIAAHPDYIATAPARSYQTTAPARSYRASA